MDQNKQENFADFTLYDGMKVDELTLKNIFKHPLDFKNNIKRDTESSDHEQNEFQSSVLADILEIKEFLEQYKSNSETIKYALNKLFKRYNAYGCIGENLDDVIQTSDFIETLKIDVEPLLKQVADYNLAQWDDPSFNSQNNRLIFPYIDGEDRLGFACLNIPNYINANDATSIVAILTSLTGVMISLHCGGNND